MKTPTPRPLTSGPRAFVRCFLAFLILHTTFFINRAAAQAPTQTAQVTGRVFNVATGYYLKNAEVRLEGTHNIVYTEDGGYYAITVPAGPVTLSASYPSTQTATVTINTTPGAASTANFELQPFIIGRPVPDVAVTSAAPGKDDDIVTLDRFVVTEDRSGQAKALQIQRAAPNAVTAIATDNYGELLQGSVGELLKYMPGVTIDYSDEDASTVRVAGLDPKYTGFTLDGIALASADESTSRANRFDQMSLTGIESIEFHQTLLARMPASTPAGKFELKSKYAFDNKRPFIRFNLGLDGSTDAIELGRSYMPDDRKHYRTYPGGRISIGGPFLNRRLGVELSLSRYANYRNNQHHQISYSYLNPDPAVNPGVSFVERNGITEMKEGPNLRVLSWRDSPRIITTNAANLSLDYKITPNLTLSLRSMYTHRVAEVFNIYVRLVGHEHQTGRDQYYGPSQGTHADSTLTYWAVDPLNASNLNSHIYTNSSYRVVKTDNYTISPRLEYKKGDFQASLRAGRSRSRADYKDGDEGRFYYGTARISGIGWVATRPSTDSPTWTLTQSAGTDWSQPDNWGSTNTYTNNVRYDAPHYMIDTQTSAYLDLTYAARVLGHPVTFRTGGGILEKDSTYRRNTKRFNFLSADGRQLQSIVPSTQNYIFNFGLGGKGGNISDQGWRVDDQQALWKIYEEHPDWFYEDTVGNMRAEFDARRDVTETVDAAYVEATSRAGRFSFNAGVRFERTKTEIMTARMRSGDEITAARDAATPEEIATGMFQFNSSGVPTTPAAARFQYYDYQQFPRTTHYNNAFLSGGIKYDFSKNLRLQLSASQAILRPDIGNLAGPMRWVGGGSIWVPNPSLKPEKTSKIFASLQWYLKPAGILSLSVYRLDIDNLQLENMIIPKEQAEAQMGYPIYVVISDEDDDGGEVIGTDPGSEPGDDSEVTTGTIVRNFRSTTNAAGTRTVYGMTLEYNQQLTFLPGALKGLSVFGSVSIDSMKNAEIDEEKIGRAGRSANGGVKYRYGRFNIELRATWQDDALMSINRPTPGYTWFEHDHLYRKARMIVDLSGGLRLNKNLELSFSVSNITNSPDYRYSNVRDRLAQYYVFGSYWTLGLKGSF